MSAGSAFASGVRAGQAIWNNAVQNAMAGKRLDMLKTQFQFEQTQRQKQLADQIASQEAYEKYLSSIPTGVDFTKKYDRDIVENANNEFFSDIIRDPAVFKQFQAFNQNLGNTGKLELWNKISNRRDGIEATWLELNNGMTPPTVENNGVVEKDYNLMKSMNEEDEEEATQKADLRKINFKLEQEWAQKFPGKPFPVLEISPLPGEPAPDTPIKDYETAKLLLRGEEQEQKRAAELFDADTKDLVEYRTGFSAWKRDMQNDALDPKNPEDQKKYRTFSHDEQISALMAEAGLEAFELADELIPDLVSGGYENMAEVTGMINDLIRKQEEDAGTRKAMAQKPLTESQAKDYIFAGRLRLMEETIAKLEAAGFKPESIPQDIMMSWLPEMAKTEDQKRYIAARANWIAAVLRRESGAAIAESEYKGGFEQYFPLVGDSPTVIAEKRTARRQVEQDMRAIATNQPILEGYKTAGEPVIYANIEDVQEAGRRGRLKVGDSYKYYNERGEIQTGIVKPPAP